MDKSAEAANKTAKAALQNAQAAQDKQITERFAKGIELLGNEKIETRLGAIYILERIAKDSKDDHWTIMEILTAFVRENAPLKPQEEVNQEVLKLRTAIRAVITVIGRRYRENDPQDSMIDLSETDFRGVNLGQVDLREASLYRANLQGVNISDAQLQCVVFTKTNLQGVQFSITELQNADFREANLQEAQFWMVKLHEANFSSANLQKANFSSANLQGAYFYEANLQGADLSGAENLEQQQIESAKGDRTTILPENLQLPEHWKAQV
ncbi:pentapeptide repeat-containing protein, partial [Nostoc sp. HG1]|nr:pentapeptide repeat-containing protein [Nostoc sp. HG1]